MAVVGAIQIAHVPILPAVVRFQRGETPPPGLEGLLTVLSDYLPLDRPLLEDMHAQFVEWQPDVAVFFDSDHFNTFFLNHIPSIAIGVDDSTSGPSDRPLWHPEFSDIPLDRALGEALHRGLVARSFDVTKAQRFAVDHSITVPLYFLTPRMDVPIVPVWINGLGETPIRSARARELGAAVREIVDEVYPDKRVVLLCSGAISLDIGTPRAEPGNVVGVPAPEWIDRVTDLIAKGDLDAIVAEATPEQFIRSGNASAELLNVVAVMSALGKARSASRVDPVPLVGHAYAVWTS